MIAAAIKISSVYKIDLKRLAKARGPKAVFTYKKADFRNRCFNFNALDYQIRVIFFLNAPQGILSPKHPEKLEPE
jgi:hypothetical protein